MTPSEEKIIILAAIRKNTGISVWDAALLIGKAANHTYGVIELILHSGVFDGDSVTFKAVEKTLHDYWTENNSERTDLVGDTLSRFYKEYKYFFDKYDVEPSDLFIGLDLGTEYTTEDVESHIQMSIDNKSFYKNAALTYHSNDIISTSTKELNFRRKIGVKGILELKGFTPKDQLYFGGDPISHLDSLNDYLKMMAPEEPDHSKRAAMKALIRKADAEIINVKGCPGGGTLCFNAFDPNYKPNTTSCKSISNEIINMFMRSGYTHKEIYG